MIEEDNYAEAELLAERLARRAHWSCGIGLAIVWLNILAIVFAAVTESPAIVSAVTADFGSWVWAAVFFVVESTCFIVLFLGVSANDPANTVNRPLGFVGWILGFMGAVSGLVWFLLFCAS